jgi:hypothetical protein
MTTTYTISDIENAINWWSAREGAVADRICLSPEVNALAEPYALLIATGQFELSAADLSPECVGLIEQARAHATKSTTLHTR